MSRIGKLPVAMPAGVEITVSKDNVVKVKGKLGTWNRQLDPNDYPKVEGNQHHSRKE
jgi:large subunit ribosomal protein L6